MQNSFIRLVGIFLLSFTLYFQVSADSDDETWTEYLSYTDAIDVAVADNLIFCATDGGLFYYDTDDNTINKYSGLSDMGIECIAYSEDEEVLLVAYTSSNIDLIYESELINLPDISNKTMSGDKSINNITFYGSEAYLSCGFGIVVINLDKQEVKDTYYIGDEGDAIEVNDVAFYNDRIYAATEEGIRYADVSVDDLGDYNNWTRDETVSYFTSEFSELEVHSGNLIAVYSAGYEMYSFDGSSWDSYYSVGENVRAMTSAEGYLITTSENNVILFDSGNSMVGKIYTYLFDNETITDIACRNATISSEGIIWIADYDNALVKLSGDDFESLYPSGPMDNTVFFLYYNNSDIWVTPGGRTDSWGNSWLSPRFQRYSSGEWTNFSSNEYSELTDFYDIVCLAVDPNDAGHLFVGSWGGGVLEFQDDEYVTRYTNLNSPLETALPSSPTEAYVRIGGLDFDSDGNLWIANTSVAGNNLHKLSPNGDWESFSMSEALDLNIGQVIVTENDDKWVIIPRGNNLYVVNDDGSELKQLDVISYFSNSSDEYFTEMSDIYSIAEDNDGEIWVGTSVGVAVYSNPSRIWTSETFYASQPGVDEGDDYYYPLLETETVTAIAVDGANRKWLGTENSGVYLVSEDGETEILNFTAENSDLLSNNITAITIDQKSGEVFFGTDKGLISYQGDATGGNDTYSDVYVYPNPVRETYTGNVTITGLIENTDVKITDISGNLVYKTTSLGGDAIWDGNNLNGNRVKTGVYLIFCNDEYGEETCVKKLLFIN